MREQVIEILNHHTEVCGAPPEIDHAATAYLGYFENRYGEQWVLVADPGGRVTLRGGDTGWNTVYEVDPSGHASGLILDEEEHAWLQACWLALRGRQGPL